MPQIAKIVDLTKGYTFVDPEVFPDNRGHTQQQDSPTDILPVLPFAGYNFLPTAYGYRSYFGDSSTLDIPAVPSRCDKLLLFQLANYKNVLIALCEDGIWYIPTSRIGATWTQAVSYPIPPTEVHYEWTYVLLENVLYCYRQNSKEVWSLSYTDFTESAGSSRAVPLIFLMSAEATTAISGTGTVADPILTSDTISGATDVSVYNASDVPVTLTIAATSASGDTLYLLSGGRKIVQLPAGTTVTHTSTIAARGSMSMYSGNLDVSLSIYATDSSGADTFNIPVNAIRVSDIKVSGIPVDITGMLGTPDSPIILPAPSASSPWVDLTVGDPCTITISGLGSAHLTASSANINTTTPAPVSGSYTFTVSGPANISIHEMQPNAASSYTVTLTP